MLSMRVLLVLLLPLLFHSACQPAADNQLPDDREAASAASNVMDVVARGLTFEGPDAVPAGWTTIRFSNLSQMVHFATVQKLPEGVTVADQQSGVAPVFQAGMDKLNEGDVDGAMAAFADLPAWFGDIVFLGGPGLVSSGGSVEVTVYLEPGTYMLECYVKTAGIFHSYNPDPESFGMVHGFTVTDSAGEKDPPEATAEITVSAESGFEGDLQLGAGPHVVAVRFLDQGPHENFVGHDIHLARLADDTELAAVEAWMDWRSPDGLITPAPVQFAGGVNEMPAGTVAYMNVTLEPGRYAWVAEVPNARQKGMLVEFDVPADGM